MPRRGRLGGDASRGRSGWARARSPTNLGANASISAVSICTPRGTSSPAAHRTPRRDAGRAGGIPPLRARDATGRARGTATFSVVDAMGLETARCRQTEREGRSRDGRLCDRGRARQPPRVCVSWRRSGNERGGKKRMIRMLPLEGRNFGVTRFACNGSGAQIFRYFARFGRSSARSTESSL